jgi:acetylornithine deacetylase/succinyl-diaminopimelate desuccinylase-like protein
LTWRIDAAFIETARKIISFDTTPLESSEAFARYLVSFSEQLGLSCEYIEEIQNGVGQANLIFRVQEKQAGTDDFLLQSQLDTLDPGPYSTWKKNSFNPFEAVIEDDTIYGLGAAKSKIDLLVKLNILAQFKLAKFENLHPVVIATFGEQSGMQGLLKLIRKNKISAKYAVISEPTDLHVANAAKGFALVEIRIPFSKQENEIRQLKISGESTSTQTKVFSGLSVHSADAHLGDSAATKLFDFLSKLPENVAIIDIDCGARMSTIPNQALVEIDSVLHLENSMIQKLNLVSNLIKNMELQMHDIHDSEFKPSHSTLSVGIIRTEENHVRLGGSCRLVPKVRQEDFEKWTNYLTTECLKIGAEFKVIDYKRPFRTPENSAFIKTALSELKRLKNDASDSMTVRSLASTNEASLLSRRGIECLCIGAGFRADHRQNLPERASIKDLQLISEFYQRMIERFCL